VLSTRFVISVLKQIDLTSPTWPDNMFVGVVSKDG
jgi:hypothetical protein